MLNKLVLSGTISIFTSTLDLLKNFDNLTHFISHFSVTPDIICISETRLKTNFPNLSLPGYEVISANSAT